MSIIDRYVVRQVLMPFLLGLLVFTFIFIIPPLLDYAERLVAKGVSGPLVAGLMLQLIPQALALTIPMSLLLALLIAFGRLSADREFIAMQACGISLKRLLKPVAMIAVTAWLLTSYVLIVIVPDANQRFLDVVFNVATQRAEGDVKPRVFFDQFPNLVLYVRDIPPQGSGWNGVFMAHTRSDQTTDVYLAERGYVSIDKEQQRIDLVLERGARHTLDVKGNYDVHRFETARFSVDPALMFSDRSSKGIRQMTIAELRAEIGRRERQIDPATNKPFSTHNERGEIYKRFSIPVACLVFGLIGLALGATHRRDGTLGSFVIGIVVVFAYYVPLIIGPALVRGQYIPPWLGAWLPNIVLGALGIVMLAWRDRLADRPFTFHLPRWAQSVRAPRARRLPGLKILDGYVAGAFVRYATLSAVALLFIFYIATFLELSDKVFKGSVTWLTVLNYFRYSTPEWVYYVLPLAVLLGTLVTIALLTKNSELIVMKACGISIYRLALPMIATAITVGAGLFLLQETILGPSTRRAAELRHIIRGNPPDTFDLLHNRWLVGGRGEIYHYAWMDPRKHVISGLDVYEFTPRMDRLARRSYVHLATYAPTGEGDPPDVWKAERAWTRRFDERGDVLDFKEVAADQRTLETTSYFEADDPEPRYMGYADLREYTETQRSSGFDVVEQDVWLWRKVAFPFVPLIMTLLAVPFAVSIGRSGAMGGIAVGIALAIGYWVLMSVFAALGAGGALPPVLAAWAPNLFFGSGAIYLLLTVRT